MKNNMRLIYNLIFVMSVILVGIVGSSMVVYGDEVIPSSEFGDVDFYNYVIAEYDTNGNGQLEQSEAEAVTRLFLETGTDSTWGVEDLYSLKGLEVFVNLTDFQLRGKTSVPITNISVFKQLGNLTSLAIYDQMNIEDFTVLGELVNLQILDLRYTNCSDIGFVSDLVNLNSLYIVDSTVKNCDAISNLTNLTELVMQNCGLTDISFLSKCTNLKYVYVVDNEITDFSVLLESKDRLTNLSIGSYFVSDENGNNAYKLSVQQLSFLKELTNLEVLSLSDSGIEELPDLTGLTKLHTIDLVANYLDSDEAKKNLPISITSSDTWITDTGLDIQREKVSTESETTSSNVDEQETIVSSEDETQAEDRETEESQKNEESTSLSEKIKNIEDIRADFDISMEGEFEDDVYVVAKKIQDTSVYKSEITELYKMFEYISDISLYDIAVYSKRTNQKLQPVGEVKVSLDLVGLAGDSYHVLRLEESGQWTEVESFVEDGKLHFYSDHFSIYSVIIESLLDKGNDRIKGKIEKNSEIDNNENNDRKFDLWVEAGIVVVIILAVFVYDKLRKRKRKKREEVDKLKI